MAKSVSLLTFHSIVKVGDWHHTLCLPGGFPYPCGAVFAGKHWDVSMADLSAAQFHMCTLQKGIYACHPLSIAGKQSCGDTSEEISLMLASYVIWTLCGGFPPMILRHKAHGCGVSGGG